MSLRESAPEQMETPACRAGVRGQIQGVLLAILLNARRTQPGKAVLIDRVLPGEEFLDGERVAGAGLFQRQQSATDRGDHLCLAADDPALGRGRRQVRNGQRTAIWPDDILYPRAMGFGHWYTHKTRLD